MERGVFTVVTFKSTFDAIEAERLCKEHEVPGRIIPLPTQVSADCGLAWRMPPTPEARAAFDEATAGHVRAAGYYDLRL